MSFKCCTYSPEHKIGKKNHLDVDLKNVQIREKIPINLKSVP